MNRPDPDPEDAELNRVVEARQPNESEDPYDSDTGVAPIPSSDPAYQQRRKMARNLAQFESFSTAKQRRIERQQGPQQLNSDRVYTYEEDSDQDKAGLIEIAEMYNDVTGRMFLHPVNLRLYEVVHIYWDRRTKQIAVLRRACDPLVVDPDDRLAYPLKGDRGVLRLIERYEQQAGYEAAVHWPSSEVEMRELQRQCSTISPLFEAVSSSPTKSVFWLKKRIYVPQRTDHDGTISYGAMRVRPMNEDEAAKLEDTQS